MINETVLMAEAPGTKLCVMTSEGGVFVWLFIEFPSGDFRVVELTPDEAWEIAAWLERAALEADVEAT